MLDPGPADKHDHQTDAHVDNGCGQILDQNQAGGNQEYNQEFGEGPDALYIIPMLIHQ